MKCILPSVNVKLFAKAIHCLAKLGSEIYIEPLDDGLAVKTVNSSRSAYASFLFLPSVFQTYENQPHNSDDDENFKCKVAVKTLLQVFKSVSNIEKSVESCDIQLNEDECRLVFQLKCRHGILKTHQLTFQECETLQAVFAKDLSPNFIKCEHKLLNDVVSNFPAAVEEITLNISPCHVKFKSYFDEEEQKSMMLKTEMTLNPEEFDDFQIGVDTEITFSLKDLRAALSFCDASSTPLHFYFETGGKPLVISTEEENSFKTHFVLATISDDVSTTQQRLKSTAKNSIKRNMPPPNSSKSKHSKTNHQSRPTNTATTTNNNKSLPQIDDHEIGGRINGFDENSCNDDQYSPEIPLQNHLALSDTESDLPSSQNQSFYQGIKQLFFEPNQNPDDHSLVVLAPDSDDECT